MEVLYNPDLMSESEMRATFVARQPLLDKLVATVERQPEGAGVQHVVLIASRGMGKTTLLIMLQLALADRGLAPPWLPIRFPEELYGVNNLADFWLEALDRIAEVAADIDLVQRTRLIRETYTSSEHLAEAALALIKDRCRRNGRKLILLIDNINQLLGTLDEQENAVLRRTLMNEGFLMIVGAAPSYFQEASDYQLPLYNFFKVERLNPLNSEEIDALLRSRASADGIEGYAASLKENVSRIRVLEYFTGGNPRLVLMLYRVLTRPGVIDVKEGLEKLLDEVTPFYKSKMESLPAQQRKIIDTIARLTGETHSGVTPREIANAARLNATVVSSQIKRLAELGFVRSANIRGRNTYYTLTEQLFTLWYQMRVGRSSSEQAGWLVDFLTAYYGSEELVDHVHHLEDRPQNLYRTGLSGQGYIPKKEYRVAEARHGYQSLETYQCRHKYEGLQGLSHADRVLLRAAMEGHIAVVRQHIAESPNQTALFPLAKAIDCLEPNGYEVLEKLTADVRPIVEELVAKLGPNHDGTIASSNGVLPLGKKPNRRQPGAMKHL